MATDSRPRTPVWLLALFFVAFAIGTDDFVIAGLLPEIAEDLAVSEAAAGQLITVFSLSYALGAPVAAVVTARWPQRRVMTAAAALFAVGNLAAAAAPTYETLFALRVLLALAAATITPAAVSTAAALAPEGRRGRYIGVVAAGLTVSLAVGVPIGTWLGGHFGWRSTLVLVAALAVLALVGMVRLPAAPRPPSVALGTKLAPLRRPAVLAALVSVFVSASGGLMVYEYVAPVAAGLSGAGTEALAALIAAAGVSGAAGTWLGARATDAFGPERTTLVAVSAQAASVLALAALGFLLEPGAVPVALFGALFAGWALAGWAFNPAMHLRLLDLAGPAGPEAVGLNGSALYLGIAVAGGLGGAALANFGAHSVPLVSGLLSLVGLCLFAWSFRAHRPGGGGRGPVTVEARRA
ncbi:MAG TPA: MFS transporter [Glycomyces sp.]|nr:MFS transporter [Glycomyces sp.]